MKPREDRHGFELDDVELLQELLRLLRFRDDLRVQLGGERFDELLADVEAEVDDRGLER